MTLHKPAREYQPIVVDVSYNQWGYQVVTISPWPGARISITLSISGLTREEAEVRALEQWEGLKALILEGER